MKQLVYYSFLNSYLGIVYNEGNSNMILGTKYISLLSNLWIVDSGMGITSPQ